MANFFAPMERDDGWLLVAGLSPNPPFLNQSLDSQKWEFIQKYAPYVYMDEGESYFPSTVDFLFPI
jgi:hypothetical protein